MQSDLLLGWKEGEASYWKFTTYLRSYKIWEDMRDFYKCYKYD